VCLYVPRHGGNSRDLVLVSAEHKYMQCTTCHAIWISHTCSHLSYSHIQALILLDLLEAGADPSRQDYEGHTALYEACRTGGTQAIEVLMAADAQ
jgi:ankyrin repeat protein